MREPVVLHPNVQERAKVREKVREKVNAMVVRRAPCVIMFSIVKPLKSRVEPVVWISSGVARPEVKARAKGKERAKENVKMEGGVAIAVAHLIPEIILWSVK
jgi:hypothetical protein